MPGWTRHDASAAQRNTVKRSVQADGVEFPGGQGRTAGCAARLAAQINLHVRFSGGMPD